MLLVNMIITIDGPAGAGKSAADAFDEKFADIAKIELHFLGKAAIATGHR